MTSNDEWVRDRAHALTPRCNGGGPIGDDHVRYHSRACDAIAAFEHEAIERGEKNGYDVGKTVARVELLARLENPDEAMVEAVARGLAAHKMLMADGSKLPDDLWRQAIPDAHVASRALAVTLADSER